MTKEQKEQANSLELAYYEKLDGFWKQLFLGCTGFVSLVVPLALKTDMAATSRKLLVCAVFVVIVATVCLIAPMLRSAAILKKLRCKAIEGKATEYTPSYCTILILVSLIGFALSIIVALILLSTALYSTIS